MSAIARSGSSSHRTTAPAHADVGVPLVLLEGREGDLGPLAHPPEAGAAGIHVEQHRAVVLDEVPGGHRHRGAARPQHGDDGGVRAARTARRPREAWGVWAWTDPAPDAAPAARQVRAGSAHRLDGGLPRDPQHACPVEVCRGSVVERTLRGRDGRRCRCDARAPAPARSHVARLFELTVGARDGARREPEVDGELAHGRQPVAGREDSRADEVGELPAQLLVGRGRVEHVDRDGAQALHPSRGSTVVDPARQRTRQVVDADGRGEDEACEQAEGRPGGEGADDRCAPGDDGLGGAAGTVVAGERRQHQQRDRAEGAEDRHGRRGEDVADGPAAQHRVEPPAVEVGTRAVDDGPQRHGDEPGQHEQRHGQRHGVERAVAHRRRALPISTGPRSGSVTVQAPAQQAAGVGPGCRPTPRPRRCRGLRRAGPSTRRGRTPGPGAGSTAACASRRRRSDGCRPRAGPSAHPRSCRGGRRRRGRPGRAP